MFVALENIRSLYNIGAIFRTCSYFGVKNVLLVGYAGKTITPRGQTVLHEEIKKVSLGSENDLNIVFIKDSQELIAYAVEHGLNLVAVEQHEKSVPLSKWTPDKTQEIVLVFGNEVDGVSPTVLDVSAQIIEIERTGSHNSLNVTTACGIVLYKAVLG